MASTVLFSINPGDTLENLTIATGPGITTKYIEVQVDLGNDVNDGAAASSPRPIKKGEVVEALNKIVQAVLRDTTYLID